MHLHNVRGCLLLAFADLKQEAASRIELGRDLVGEASDSVEAVLPAIQS